MIAELPSLFAREEYRQAASLLLNWFYQLREYGRMSPADYAEIETTYRSVEETRTMLLTALEKEREEIRRDALEEGIEQGIDQGAIRERRANVCAMHAKGYASDVIADLLDLTLEQVTALLTDEQPDA